MRGARLAALAFVVSTLASLSLAVVYVLGGQAQLEGTLLGVGLGGLGVGLVAWAKHLMPTGPFVQARKVTLARTGEIEEVAESFEEGAATIGRRRFLARLLAVSLGAFGIAAVFPIRSLGTRPGRQLFHTSWRKGSRAVTDAGQPIRPAELPVDSVLTVFPEGAVGVEDSQTLLIRLPAGDYRALPGREGWAPDDVVAFSKICTHAGCPVGLYRADTNQLFCPCHQSVFDVLQGAKPAGGPATTALPQLPLDVDGEGYLVARSDYTEPVGPGFWNRNRA
ncbi:MAG: ubiquinol-cytochrome c reductase iron-sulfur subunit [Actinomycetota bacterium]|jgi:ubiquinol-cytochrome c reductase iron-sulfur subunit|nr:ubiquinol-cytochrome c reductase iron-sulfur subunit [Actinomycetota bacterium]